MTGVVVTPKFCMPFSALWSAYRQGHAQGHRLLAAAGIPTESRDIAITVEQYRWAWRPQKVRILLLGESHIYTSAHDFKFQLNPYKLPPFPPSAPTSFVRIIYCLGYGEPELLSGKPKRRNTGTRQFWDLFGRLAATGQAPRKKETPALCDRINWKIETLRRLQERGIWVQDASLHAMYFPGGSRISSGLKFALNQIWWESYGGELLKTLPGAQIWAIGKTVAQDLTALGLPLAGWIYQPGAGRSPQRDLECGWQALMNAIQEAI